MGFRLSVVSAMPPLVKPFTEPCQGQAFIEGGNWFCKQVSSIKYENIGGDGRFQDVTGMSINGECQMAEKPFSGPLAPLDEDVSSLSNWPARLSSSLS